MNPETPPLLSSPPGPRVVVDGRSYLYFAGTSYLGLNDHPAVLAAAAEALVRFGTGSATSRAAYGHTPPLVDAEREAAALLGTDGAVILPSGWLGASALRALLASRYDRVAADAQAHDALLAAFPGPVIRFDHLDPDALAAVAGPRTLVLTDGVFSLSGDVAPLADHVAVLARHEGCGILVDDAHGLGVLGAHGRGTVEAAGLTANRDDGPVAIWSTATLGKAVGGYGGVIAGPAAFVRRIRDEVPVVRATSPLPPAVLAGTAAALRLVREEPERRAALRARAVQLRSGLRRLGVDVPATEIPVAAIRGDPAHLRRVHASLRDRGLLVGWFPRYAGTGEQGALRLAVFATHAPDQVDTLLEALGAVL